MAGNVANGCHAPRPVGVGMLIDGMPTPVGEEHGTRAMISRLGASPGRVAIRI